MKDELLEAVRTAAMQSQETEEQRKWPVVACFAAPTEVAEIVVRWAARESGCPMNWGFVGGRALVRTSGDRRRCLAFLKRALPSLPSIDISLD